MSPLRRGVLASLALSLAISPLASQDSARVVRTRTLAEDLQMFGQVLNQIRVNHPDSADTHRLMLSAIAGVLRATDPHSYVIPAMRLSPEREQMMMDGRLVPVPIAFQFSGGTPVVSSVSPGTYAARQDVQRGDVLVAIDGKSVSAESADELSVMMAGPRKSTVTLTFERERSDGSRARLERSVRREVPDPTSAIVAPFLLSGNTGYVRITTFSGENIARDLDAALRTLEGRGMTRLVLDLRDNGGGRVDEATLVAGAFLPAKTIVYTSRGKKEDVIDTGRVARSFWRSERKYPVAVLVNSGTASASELVAGALQDHDRAVVVGRPTFGKALLMRGFPLMDGSMVMLVIGHIQTPCGRVVQRAYRDVAIGQYYRLAGAARDTVGRPSCKTDAGRTVYGGGGIYPDVLVPHGESLPLWASRLDEDDVIAQWAAAWVGQGDKMPATLDAYVGASALGPAEVTNFRTFARGKGAVVPDGAEADALLAPRLRAELALQKWGEQGYYRIVALTDGEVHAAIAALPTQAP